MTLGLVLAAALAVACVVAVAWPFLREPEPRLDRVRELTDLERRQVELAEARDRALGALKELEFDHRTGKVADQDYRALVGPLRRQAADALRALEPRAVRPAAAADTSAERAPEEPSPEAGKV